MRSLLILSITIFYTLTSSGQEISLFNKGGDAIAYIDTNDEMTIYTWNGAPVAYLSNSDGGGLNIYGFNGKHLGWYEDGLVRNHEGDVVGFKKGALDIYTNYEEYKDYKEYKPHKQYQEYEPYKPYYSDYFSNTSLSVFLVKGKSNATVGVNSNTNNNSNQTNSGRGISNTAKGSRLGLELDFEPTLEAPDFNVDGLVELGEQVIQREREQMLRDYEREMKQIDVEYDRKKEAREHKSADFDEKIEDAKTKEQKIKLLEEKIEYLNSTLYTDDVVGLSKREWSQGKTNLLTRKNGIEIRFPHIESQDDNSIQLYKVEVLKNETILHFKHFASSDFENGGWININPDCYISCRKTGLQFKLKKAHDIPKSPKKHWYNNTDEITKFSLVFQGLHKKEFEIDFIECEDDSCFNFYGIDVSRD